MSVTVGVSHCGAGCTLGDIIGAWIVFAVSWKLLGLALPGEYIAGFTLAFALGIAFQYFSIAPMRDLGVRDGVLAALKADTLSLTAFEIGLFGWMAIIQLVFFTGPHLDPDHAAYWLLMQIGMVLGLPPPTRSTSGSSAAASKKRCKQLKIPPRRTSGRG